MHGFLKVIITSLLVVALSCITLQVHASTVKGARVKPKIASSDHKQNSPPPAKSTQQFDDATSQPWQLIRHLQHAQDAIVSGRPGSLDTYRKLLVRYSGLMLAQNDKVWSIVRNLNAAAIYVLVGGNPAVGKKAIEKSSLDDEAKKPLRGAIAYSERNFTVAHRLLMALDHTILPASSAAQFALAKSMVTSSINLDLAGEFLGEARRLAPGTLIDEASLRRALRIAGGSKDFQKFRLNASRYYRNFQNSLYFGNFLKNFSYGLARMPQESQIEVLEYLQGFIEKLDDSQQLQILVYTARSATVSGRTKIAYWASNQVIKQLDVEGGLYARMVLYSVASGLVQPDLYKVSLAQIDKIDRLILNENDQKLLNAVNSLAMRLQSDPMNTTQLKRALRALQNTYPGDEPNIPGSVKNKAELFNTNDTVKRSQKLFSDLEKIMPGNSK